MWVVSLRLPEEWESIFTVIGRGESVEDMKVVHLGIGLIPVPPVDIAAGREEYIYHLTNHLGRLGCQVHVIDIKGGAPQREKRQESSAKFHEAWHLPLPHRYNPPFWEPLFNYLRDRSSTVFFGLSSSLILNRLLGREKIEVIHAHDREVALATIIASKLRRNRAVTVYTPQAAYGLTKWSRRQRLIRFAEILALKWADHIVALTPEVKEWLVSEFNLDPAKITPIHLGVAMDKIEQFLSHKAVACHQSNMVLCTGVVQPRKNQLTAVKAISQVIKTHPRVKLVFAGPVAEVKYLASIQRFIAENNLSSHVEFKGEVTRQELYNLYSDAILFLFPTTAEVQPTVLMEALAFGLPVISSTIEPIADVVSEKGCAILVDPYDVDGIAAAVTRVLDDTSLRQSMSERAKELARSFSYENIAAQTLALYEKLVQNKKQSPR
jgi:glycosyltransferase involved in cell wall biosynthesis